MSDITHGASEAFDWGQLAPRRTTPAPEALRPVWRHRAERSQSGLACRFESDWAVLPAMSDSRLNALVAKRAVDILLALAALFALLPLLIGTAVAVKLTSPGPVFFRQKRPGLGGKPFEMLKFRTMYEHAGDASGIQQTTTNDLRVTPIGRFLRNKSIDELPQLINVLKGDMSIVGPRPHVEGMLAGGVPYEELVPYYKLRHDMRPGLSGWAQANGLRGPTLDTTVAKARVDHDLAYIQNFSLMLDAEIIWLTIKREFLSGTGV